MFILFDWHFYIAIITIGSITQTIIWKKILNNVICTSKIKKQIVKVVGKRTRIATIITTFINHLRSIHYFRKTFFFVQRYLILSFFSAYSESVNANILVFKSFKRFIAIL